MLIRRALVAVASLAASTLVTAASTARNPLKAVGVARNPDILTQNHRVTAVSTFDVAFDFSSTRIRLSLEPNHDIIAEGAVVQYVSADGRIMKEEPINRLEHKVFKGKTWLKRGNRWDNVGWARITIRRDGVYPLFEGAFTVNHDHHHIQLSTSYKQTKHAMDPEIDLRDDEFMVVFRDSDISMEREHTELRKRTDGGLGCRSDDLEFNTLSDHPVYTGMAKRDEDEDLWSVPASGLIDKRQNGDVPSGGGNSAGVNLVQSFGKTDGCPSTRKVALVGVATDCTYTGSFNSSESARQNVINQINSASNLYENTFNISLGLQNLFVTEANCPTSVQSSTPWNQACSNNVDIQARLNLFSQWRGQQKDTNSHWTLLSTCNTGSAVGLAWLGQACVQGSQGSNSSSGSQETVAGANVVVRTSTEWQVIAHETGHTFGAVHDCTADACKNTQFVQSQQCCVLNANTCDAGEKFIMNPSTAQGITNFSPCSIGNICSAMLRNSVKSSCLTNNRGVTTISGQQCGNGIVEQGEDCDCGGEQSCGDNACCDAKTCKFKNGAVCDDSNEDCCKDCKLAPATTVCRKSSGQCDPEEKCTGTTPYCPEDKTQPDGSDCGSGLKCASGQCTSRDQQCKTVMGSYTQGNDTYACDSSNCMLSCGSPEFGRGVCYGLQQNFLDGTPCTGGGHCQNGQCAGASVGKEVTSWINDHKPLVIGLASAIGGLILLSVLGCCYRCIKRRKNRKLYANSASYRIPANPSQYNRGFNQYAGNRGAPGGSRRPAPPVLNPNGNGQQQQMSERSWQGGNVPSPPPMYTRSSSVRYA